MISPSAKRISTYLLSIGSFIPGLIVLLIFTFEPAKKMSSFSLLCLGDSYTIGEMVLPSENFPNQTTRLLNKDGYEFEAPEIVATTGWTTDELQHAIDQHRFKTSYDFVTLLIGVNNQYRGRTTENYKPQFESLLKQAIRFANGEPDHVIVLSIPDWGITSFAKNSGRDQQQVSKEIDEYNIANKEISEVYKVHYIDITPSTRQAAQDPGLLAEDDLHPSAKEYAKWSLQLSVIIETMITGMRS